MSLFACHLPERLEKGREAYKYKRFLFACHLPEQHIEKEEVRNYKENLTCR